MRTRPHLSVTRPLRVGFVLHIMQVAGAEILVREIIYRLRGSIEPIVFCLDGIGTIGEQLRNEGVEVIALGRRPGRDWSVARRMAAVVHQRRIQLLHAHQYTPLFYTVLAKFLARRRPRIVFTEHGRHYPDLVSPMRRRMNRFVFDRLTDSVTAVCEFTKRSLIAVEGFSERKIEVIENGIELDRYGSCLDRGAAKQRLGLDPTRRYVTTIARFHPVKDHAMLLRAFRDLAATHGDVELLLAGDGPTRLQSEQLSRELCIAERVRFLGVRNDVPELLRASDVFALTSVSEAASLTLLEAMASGTPCVVTNVGGNPELVRDGVDGQLVPRGDSASTASAIARVLADPVLAASLGAAAAERVRERFQLSRTIEAYWALYQRLCFRREIGADNLRRQHIPQCASC